jgi:hypothetical protein
MRSLLSATLLLVSTILFNIYDLNAQCANDNSLTAGSLTPAGVGMTTTFTFNSGQYVLAYVEKGASYTVSTCGAGYYDEWGDYYGPFDTQLIVYYDATGAFAGYNDDNCGLLSAVSFTATRCGWVRVELDQYSCNNSGLACQVQMIQNTPGTSMLSLHIGPDENTCPGVPILVGDTATGGTVPYTYSWDQPLLMDNASLPNASATVNNTTPLILTATDADFCYTSDTITLVTYPQPFVGLGPDTLVCGNTILLDAANPSATVEWNDASTSQTLLVDTTGIYDVTITDTNGCIDTDSILINLYHLPVIELGNDTSYCGGQRNFDLTQPGIAYEWNDGSTLSTHDVSITGMVSVLITDSISGCVNTDTIHLVFHPLPSVSVGNDTTLCGTSFTVYATTGFSSYTWNDASADSALVVGSSGIYSVEVLDSNGCNAMDSISVTMFDYPIVDLGIDSSQCTGALLLDAGNPGADYTWSDLSTQQTLLVNSTGTYYVAVTDTNNCTSLDSIDINIYGLPSVNASSLQTTFCLGSTPVLLTGTPSGGTFSGAGTSGNNFDPQQAGTGIHNIIYTYSDLNACENSDTITMNVMSCAGIEQSIPLNVDIYPNPSNGIFNFAINTSQDNDVLIRVSDIQGQVVGEYLKKELFSGAFQLDLTGIDKGIYLVTIQSGMEQVTRKVIIR